MNKYHKMLQVLDVDLQNLDSLTGEWLKGVRDDLREEALIAHYMTLTTEEIDRIHEEYYGTEAEEKAEDEEIVMMIVGEINSPHPQATDKYADKILVNEVQLVLFVPKSQVDEIGEQYLARGYDAYLAPSMVDAEICSESYWYLFDEYLEPITIDDKMRVAVGFHNCEEMEDHYKKKGILIRRVKEADVCTFWWDSYDRSVDCVGHAKPKEDPHSKALKVCQIAETIVEDGTLYQNLYRCTEAYPALLGDDQMWKDVMNKVITIIQDQVEPHNKGDE